MNRKKKRGSAEKVEEHLAEGNVGISEKARNVSECPKERDGDPTSVPDLKNANLTIEAFENEESSGKVKNLQSNLKKQFPAVDLHMLINVLLSS